MRALAFRDYPERHIRNKFTIMTFVCSIFVIYIHTYNLELYEITAQSRGFGRAAWLLEEYSFDMLHIATSLFMMVSAILFYRNFSIEKLWEKWRSRLTSLVVPYLLWASLYYIFFAAVTNLPVLKGMFTSGMQVSVSAGEWLAWLWPRSYDLLWFLKELILFVAAAPAIWLLLKEHIPHVPLGLAILIGLTFFAPQKLRWTYSKLDFYLAGSYIGLNCRDYLKRGSRLLSWLAAGYILYFIAADFRLVPPGTAIWNTNWSQIFLFAAFWYALDLIPSLGSASLPWWMYAGFFTYVSHAMLLDSLEKLLYVTGGRIPPLKSHKEA